MITIKIFKIDFYIAFKPLFNRFTIRKNGDTRLKDSLMKLIEEIKKANERYILMMLKIFKFPKECDTLS